MMKHVQKAERLFLQQQAWTSIQSKAECKVEGGWHELEESFMKKVGMSQPRKGNSTFNTKRMVSKSS